MTHSPWPGQRSRVAAAARAPRSVYLPPPRALPAPTFRRLSSPSPPPPPCPSRRSRRRLPRWPGPSIRRLPRTPPRAWDPVAAASGEGVLAAAPAAPGRVGRIAMPRIDRARVEETADTIMLVGSFGLVLSFLAPWADVVIGSRGRDYMDTWGLAGSGHIALFLLALGVLALAGENPSDAGCGPVSGVALGGFVLGLPGRTWSVRSGPDREPCSPGCPGSFSSSRGSSASSSSVTPPCRRTSERSLTGRPGRPKSPATLPRTLSKTGSAATAPRNRRHPPRAHGSDPRNDRRHDRRFLREPGRPARDPAAVRLSRRRLAGNVLLGVPRHAAAHRQPGGAVPRRRGDHPLHPVLLLPAVWVYKIIRPHEKIGEVWERNLAEEALLAEVRNRSTRVRPATGGSTRNGSSAPPAGRG